MESNSPHRAWGTVTTWAGTARVEASGLGVRYVWLPDWRDRPLADGALPPVEATPPAKIHVGWAPPDGDVGAHLRQALGELADYFAGRRRAFTVALGPEGTDLYRAIWARVAAVPCGETRTYGEIAREVGLEHGARAVGAANAANPVAPFVPCHRLVGSDGALTGYASGLALKRALLLLEDALPATEADYPAWVVRVAARLGSERFVLGVRGTGHYCRPECSRARSRCSLPQRIARTPEEAEAAGFRPCPRCRPDAG